MRLIPFALASLLASSAAAADCGDAASQLALNQCAAADLQAADAALDAAYRQIIARLQASADTVLLLRAAQRAWVAFRDRECAFAASSAAQGSIYPLIVSNCRTELTKRRTEQLGQYLQCAEGDLGCPVPGP